MRSPFTTVVLTTLALVIGLAGPSRALAFRTTADTEGRSQIARVSRGELARAHHLRAVSERGAVL